MSTVAERKEQYEQSALKHLFEHSGHVICKRCYCCDEISESAPCWQCNGFDDEDDEWMDICSVCQGEGEIYFPVCVGGCDDNGEHKPKVEAGDTGKEGTR